MATALGLDVIGLVDDDPDKQGARKHGLVIQAARVIDSLEPEAVLITTFRHAREIRRKIDRDLRSSVRVWEL